MPSSNDIGASGESLAALRLTAFCRDDDEPYFRVHPLGEKCETLDLLVELVNAGETTPYFFVQVKTTRKPFRKKKPRLVVSVDQKDIRRMIGFPAPTYVIGVYLSKPPGKERAFIVSVHGKPGERISSLSTEHELTCETLKRLWEEVLEYWQTRSTTRSTSHFLN